MAAVVSGCNWCKLLLSLLLVLSFAAPAAQFINQDATSWISRMELTGRDALLTVQVEATTLTTEQERDLSELDEAINDALNGDDKASQERLQEERENYLSDIKSVSEPLEGVDVYFYYNKRYTPETQAGLAHSTGKAVNVEEPIPGCDPAPPTDSEGKTTCLVPEEVYTHELVQDGKTLVAQGCVEVFAVFGDPDRGSLEGENYKPSTESILVCGRDATTLGIIAGMVNAALLNRLADPLCLPAMLMAGLLLASMFFAGRSPHSLMDITTPLLPKPKTISYGGLTMGVGFGRMVGYMGEIAKSLQTSAKATMPEMLSILRSRGVSRKIINEIMDSKASHTLKLLALRAALAGKDRAFIRRIIRLRNFKWVESEDDKKVAQEYGKILKELRDAPGTEELNLHNSLHDRIMGLVDMDVQNQMQMKSFAKATGDVPSWITKSVAKTLGRVPMLGEMFKGSRASYVFGLRRIPRMYSSLARGAVRGIDRVTTGGRNVKRIQMTVDRKGKKASKFQRWVALTPVEKNLVTLYDNFEKGAADYKRLMKEAKRDVIEYLLGCILDHYFKDGRGRINLTREQVMQIGPKGPDELLFANFNMRGFRAIEFELRRILSDGNLTDVQKAARIMKLMRSRGIGFDPRAIAALKMLRRIEVEVPQSFDNDAEYDTPEDRESVVNAHRYLRLYRYLEDQFQINKPIDFNSVTRNKQFTFLVGRPQLYDSMGNDYTFGSYFRSTYRRVLERSDTIDGFDETGNTLLHMTGADTFARIANERFGVVDPDAPGNHLLGKTEMGVDVKQVMKNMHAWLKELAVVSEFAALGKSPAKFGDLISELYSPGNRDQLGKDSKDMLSMNMHQEEHGPRKGLWRLDMHAHWRTVGGPMRGAVSCVEEQAYGEVKRAHMVPRAVQDMLDESYRRGGKLSFDAAEKIRMNELIQSHLFTRLKGIMEEDNPNTRFTSKGEFDRFIGLWDSYRAHLFNTMNEGGRYRHYTSVSDSDIKKYTKKALGLDELSSGVWLRLREGQYVPFVTDHATKLGQADRIVNARYYIKREGRWSEFAPDTLMRGKPLRELVFGQEGSVLRPEDVRNLSAKDLKRFSDVMQAFEDARARALAASPDKNNPRPVTRADLRIGEDELRRLFSRLSAVSDAGNEKSVRGCGAAVMSMFKENGTELGNLFGRDIRNMAEIRNAKLRDAVAKESMINRYLHPENSLMRENALKELKLWARAGTPKEDRTTKLALLFYQQGRESGNWRDFNNYNEAIRLMPASAPLPQEMREERMPVTNIRSFLKRAFYSASDVLSPHLKNMNMGIEQFMLSSFGDQTRAEYEGSLTSEYFRQTGGKFAAKLAAGEFGNPMDRNSPAMKAYNELVDNFMRYHAVWDETITRDPRGNSSAIGNAFIFSSFFHMGPATAYGPAPYRRWSYGGFNKPWHSWSNIKSRFLDMQFAPFVFNYAVGSPFLLGYRSYITNRWGFLSKYDRSYSGMGAAGFLSKGEAQSALSPSEEARMAQGRLDAMSKQQGQHMLEMQAYGQRLNDRISELVLDGVRRERAEEEAKRQLASSMPQMPMQEFDRNTLKPFNMTQPRFADARRSMVNWFYSSFDPRAATKEKTMAGIFSSPALPLYMLPSRWMQDKLMNNGFFLMKRADQSPYYDRPTSRMRNMMMKTMGPMVDRGYGGAEMQRGVTRAVEDTWMFQSGVNAIWGNANPGVSYVDMSQNIHVDPRAANYLRYESRFRPFFKEDQYIDRQANLGLIKRDIDPFEMLMERNNEIQSYKLFRGGKIGDNSLFRFLNPVLWGVYKGREYKEKLDRVGYSLNELLSDNISNNGMNRGGRVIYAADRFARQKVQEIGNYVKRKVVLGATKGLSHCGSCGAPHAAGSACTACKKKLRCPHCRKLCNPFQNHSCSFGVQRNLKMDELRGDSRIERELERRRKWGRAA
jgi:hypothetical protein